MKNVSVVINGVLFVAVVVLFVLFFNSKDNKSNDNNQGQAATEARAVEGEMKIAYVNVDSVLTHYKMAQDMSAELIKRKDNLENELTNKGQKLEKRIADYQYKVSKGLITSWDAAEEEKKLSEEQQVFLNLQNDMQNRLLTDEQKANQTVHNTIMEAVKDYNLDKGYKLIFSHAYGGVLLYAEDYMNITSEILTKLNAEYENSK